MNDDTVRRFPLNEDIKARLEALNKTVSERPAAPTSLNDEVEGVISPDMSDLMDAKIAAAEARTDTKFAQVIGELRTLDAKISALPGRWTVFGAALTAAGLILAALAFGNDMFSRGFTSNDVAQAGAERALAAYAAQHPSSPPK